MMDAPEIVVVVFDGLRPDLVTQRDMPVLRRFLDTSATFVNSRCVFPSQTRVNAAALGAGARPSATGIVMNKMFDPLVFEDKILHTGMSSDISAAQAASGDRYVDCVTLGDTLAAIEKRFAVVSTASVGTTHFVNPNAAGNDQVRICLRKWDTSHPAEIADQFRQKFGPVKDAAFPNVPQLRQQTVLFLDGVIPLYRPDVALLWYNEPDWTQHRHGLGSVQTVEALRALDMELAVLLNALPDNTHFIITSDHGHITAQEHVALPELFDDAKIPFRADQVAPFVGTLGSTSGMWLRKDDRKMLFDVVTWLMEQPWCGMVFSDIEGGSTVPRAIIGNTHARSPALFFTTRSNNDKNVFGIPGSGYFSGDAPLGTSFHGGVSTWEMHNLLSLSGPRIFANQRISSPADICDIAPTILAILGVDIDHSMTGRVLWEAFEEARATPKTFCQHFTFGDTVRDVNTASMDGRSYFLDAQINQRAVV